MLTWQENETVKPASSLVTKNKLKRIILFFQKQFKPNGQCMYYVYSKKIISNGWFRAPFCGNARPHNQFGCLSGKKWTTLNMGNCHLASENDFYVEASPRGGWKVHFDPNVKNPIWKYSPNYLILDIRKAIVAGINKKTKVCTIMFTCILSQEFRQRTQILLFNFFRYQNSSRIPFIAASFT